MHPSKLKPWWNFTPAFLGGMRKHCWWWISTLLGGAACYLTERGIGVIPGWGIAAIVSSGFVIAAFRIWLDERRAREDEQAEAGQKVAALESEIAALKKSRLDQRRQVFLDTVANIRNGTFPFLALHLAKAAQLESNDDVLWVANQFLEHNQPSPLEMIEGCYEPTRHLEILRAFWMASVEATTEQQAVIWVVNYLDKTDPKPPSQVPGTGASPP